MHSLLSDTIRFLKEQPCSNWTIPPSQVHLKQASPTQKKEEEKPLGKSISSSVASETIHEELLPEPPTLGVSSLSESVKKLFPNFSIHKEAPKESDMNQTHRKILQAKVVLFSFREGKESDLFLQNIQRAITSHFIEAGVLDVKKWESKENLDLFFKQSKPEFIISSSSLYQAPSLLPFLKEISDSPERFLGSSRLFLLKPFKQYFDHPLQKKDLWQTLCAILKNNSLSNTPASS